MRVVILSCDLLGLASLLSCIDESGGLGIQSTRSDGDGNGRLGNAPYDRQNAYKYLTRLRKHAVNANLPLVELWLVVSQR